MNLRSVQDRAHGPNHHGTGLLFGNKAHGGHPQIDSTASKACRPLANGHLGMFALAYSAAVVPRDGATIAQAVRYELARVNFHPAKREPC